MLVFDLESNGLLKALTRVHCLHIGDTETGKIDRYDLTVEELTKAKERLENADCIAGHNIINFDNPAIKKVFGDFNPKGRVLDTLIWARLIWPDIGTSDIGRIKVGKMPANMRGRYSLESFGYRLGCWKGDYSGGWEEWNQEMSDYCEQDVVVTMKLVEKLLGYPISDDALDLEMQTAIILQLQETNGFGFNEQEGMKLYAELSARREEIKERLQAIFPPFYLPDGKNEFTPKRDNKKMGYVAGAPMRKIKLTEFNAGSTAHIVHNLKLRYGWKPTEFTKSGLPAMDEDVMKNLPYPEAKALCEYFVIIKVIGMVAEGKNAWLKLVTEEGLIHGSVNSVGAVTRRMTHSKPNIAQCPSVSKDKDGNIIWGLAGKFGAECRSLFRPTRKGWVQVGGDASGLELRCLAHYMGRWDNGAYAKEVLEGDIHTVNQVAAGLNTRDEAKRFIYAYLYGCGDWLLGTLKTGEKALQFTDAKLRQIGKKIRAKFQAGLPALSKLVEGVQAKAKSAKQFNSLDGSVLKVRSAHSALNLLLQSCGAIVMKRALVILYHEILTKEKGWVHGKDYAFMANVHDEFQMECPPEKAEELGQAICDSIYRAGLYYAFRIPLAGEYKVGATWKDCH